MSYDKYIIYFESENNTPIDVIEVYARSTEQALILAQAEQIKLGGDYKVKSIFNKSQAPKY